MRRTTRVTILKNKTNKLAKQKRKHTHTNVCVTTCVIILQLPVKNKRLITTVCLDFRGKL